MRLARQNRSKSSALLESEDLARLLTRMRGRPPTLSEQLTHLLDEKGLKRPRVIAAADLDATFGYQIFVGERRASRNKLLALCAAMELSIDEANSVLRSGGVNELYPGDRRDLIVMYGLHYGYSYQQIQEALYHYRLDPLG